MKNILLFFLVSLSFQLVAQESFFTSDPSLSPDGNTIVFVYHSNLWRVDTEGGQASQITSFDGDESRPHYSPDGKWIAFTSTQFGNKDVFVIPSSGGSAKQLTYHAAFDDVDGWSWDSKNIHFTSNRYNRYTGFAIPVSGGTPDRLFNHYFNTAHNIAQHPSSGEIFFNESWESKNFAHRKRYKGDYNPDIKSYNPKTKSYKEYTTYRGKDFGATIDKNGKIYFMSDEANGEYNLYQLLNGEKKQLTDFTTSIYWPQVSADGSKIVFRKDYQIYVYDVASGKTAKPNISLFKNFTLNKEDNYSVSGNISDFDISDDHKKIAFVSRGRLFVSDIEGKYVKQMNTPVEEAVREVHWLKDNKTLFFSQSKSGYYNWQSTQADGSTAIISHTSDIQNNRHLSFNSDQSKGAYLSGRNEVRMIDLTTMISETIARDELWGFYNNPPVFSPDDRFLAYEVYRNFENDIMVYNFEDKKSVNLTNTMVSESAPVWSNDGKHLFFATDLTNPSFPYGPRKNGIYAAALEKIAAPIKGQKFNDLWKEEKKDEKEEVKKDKEKDAEEKKEEPSIKVSINPKGFMGRIERISPQFGQQRSPYIIKDKDKTLVLYLSNHNEGKSYLWKTTIEPFENNKTEQLSKEEINGYTIKEAKGKYYLLTKGHINSLDPSNGKMEKIDISHSFSKSLADEFHQMYYEAWAGVEENFYDGNFHGENWQELRDLYATYLPYMTNRSDLRLIFNDMLGELNTSHFGFRSSGSEENTFYGFQTVETGIIWDKNNPYKVAKIVKDSPLDVVDAKVKVGDVLVKVEGVLIDKTRNRESYFSSSHRKAELDLTFSSLGKEMDVTLHTIRWNNLSTLLYDEWQDENQNYVDGKSGNKIAYIHMKNMTGGELQKFKENIVREVGYKDGLILDLRFNTGGNVHDDVLNILSQRKYLQWKYRDGALSPQPNFSPADKPIVILINEQSLSDAEMTASGFKELGLGTIIGTETYRWIIFTTGNGLVDGSFYRLPAWGCYTLDGRNLEKEGVSPDIRVEKSFEDRIENKHPQLDAAINLIKAKWQEKK